MSHDVVVLDRVVPGIEPDYCIHGRATCVTCKEWVWLGSNTVQAVTNREVLPMCMECARAHIPPTVRATTNLTDHRRADGPHT